MTRNEARSFARQIATEIQIELQKAGHDEAAKVVGSKEMLDHVRSIADHLSEYD